MVSEKKYYFENQIFIFTPENYYVFSISDNESPAMSSMRIIASVSVTVWKTRFNHEIPLTARVSSPAQVTVADSLRTCSVS